MGKKNMLKMKSVYNECESLTSWHKITLDRLK